MPPAEAKITSKGQITLPSRVRERLKVGPGDKVVFVERGDGEVTVRSRSGTLADMKGMLRGKAGRLKAGAIEGWIGEARARAGRQTEATTQSRMIGIDTNVLLRWLVAPDEWDIGSSKSESDLVEKTIRAKGAEFFVNP